MPKLAVKSGTTSKSVGIFIQDSSSTVGAGLTGLLFNSAGLTAYWYQPGVTAPAAITLATLASATAAFSSGGFKELDATNAPGHYRFDPPNAPLTGATSVVFVLKGATNMVQVQLEIELDAVDYQDAVAFGLSRVDAAVSSRASATDYTTARAAKLDNLDAAISSRSTFAGGAVASVTGNVGGNVTGSVGSIASGGIIAASFAAGAIDAAAIATDAIGSAEISAAAVTKIQNGLSTLTAAQVNTEADTALADVGLTTTITGRIDAAISSRMATFVYTAPLDAAGTRTAVGMASANLDTQLSGINAKTTNLPSDPADASDVAAAFSTVNSTLATVAAYVDTEVAAIKLVTDHVATMIELDGSVYRYTTNALEQGPSGGGGGSTTITPLQVTSNGNKVATSDVVLIQYGTETYTWVVVDGTGEPVDLSGVTVRLSIFTDSRQIPPSTTSQYESPDDLTISGDDSNQVTRTFSTTDSGTVGTSRYVLWNQTDGVPLAQGTIRVAAGAR